MAGKRRVMAFHMGMRSHCATGTGQAFACSGVHCSHVEMSCSCWQQGPPGPCFRTGSFMLIQFAPMCVLQHEQWKHGDDCCVAAHGSSTQGSAATATPASATMWTATWHVAPAAACETTSSTPTHTTARVSMLRSGAPSLCHPLRSMFAAKQQLLSAGLYSTHSAIPCTLTISVACRCHKGASSAARIPSGTLARPAV
jgi:hypothetical protein